MIVGSSITRTPGLEDFQSDVRRHPSCQRRNHALLGVRLALELIRASPPTSSCSMVTVAAMVA